MLPSINFGEVWLDPAAPPARGELQYVRVRFYYTGSDWCRDKGGSRAQIEVIPPPGAALAISATAPALCTFDFSQPPTPCRTESRPGEFGGTIVADGRGAQPVAWPLTDGVHPTSLIVPVRLDREFRTYAQTAEVRCDPLGPCAADRSGDRVQFVARFIPGDGATPSRPLLTTVGLLGGAASSGGTQGGASPSSSLWATKPPGRVTRAKLRRGFQVKVSTPSGARASAVLKVAARTVASARRTAGTGGTVALRLKASRAALDRLGRRSRKAKLTVTVTQGARSTSESVSLKIT